MNAPARDYVRQFGLSMIAYTVVLVGSILLLQTQPAPPLAVLIALAPVVPVVFGLLALVRFVGRLDELQRRIHLKSLVYTTGATAILTFSYGLLENAGFAQISWVWVLPLMVAIWGLATMLVSRKYQ
jgi:hypothetical protein